MAQAIANVIEQYGPYGSQLPENYRVQLADGERFTKLTVDSGFVVDGIRFVIAKPDGCTRTVQIGGTSPPTSTHFVNQIALKDGEYLTRVSGTYGYDRDRKQVGVATLKIHTNLCPQGYGPFGKGKNVDNLCNFSSPTLTDGPIVGVFGRSNAHLESIGVFSRKRKVIEQYGPYGSQLSENYRVQLADCERFTKLTVDSGFVVDGIRFVIAKPNGCTRTVQIGGTSPPTSTHFVNQIALKDGEYLTRVSGKYGYDRDRKQVGVATLKIHTNLCPQGYGPFGQGKNVDDLRDFSSPTLTDGPVVGVFGRSNAHLESIGVLVRKECACAN